MTKQSNPLQQVAELSARVAAGTPIPIPGAQTPVPRPSPSPQDAASSKGPNAPKDALGGVQAPTPRPGG